MTPAQSVPQEKIWYPWGKGQVYCAALQIRERSSDHLARIHRGWYSKSPWSWQIQDSMSFPALRPLSCWAFNIDEARCLPVRPYPWNTSELLFIVWYHGAPPTRRSGCQKSTVGCPCPCGRRSMSCPVPSSVIILILSWARSNAHTRCTPLEILLLPASHSTPKIGAWKPHSSWITLPMTSTRGIGILFSAHSTHSPHWPQRRRLYAIAFWKDCVNESHSLFPTLPLLLAMIEYPGDRLYPMSICWSPFLVSSLTHIYRNRGTLVAFS